MLENWWRQGERTDADSGAKVIRARVSEQGATMSDQGQGRVARRSGPADRGRGAEVEQRGRPPKKPRGASA